MHVARRKRCNKESSRLSMALPRGLKTVTDTGCVIGSSCWLEAKAMTSILLSLIILGPLERVRASTSFDMFRPCIQVAAAGFSMDYDPGWMGWTLLEMVFATAACLNSCSAFLWTLPVCRKLAGPGCMLAPARRNCSASDTSGSLRMSLSLAGLRDRGRGEAGGVESTGVLHWHGLCLEHRSGVIGNNAAEQQYRSTVQFREAGQNELLRQAI